MQEERWEVSCISWKLKEDSGTVIAFLEVSKRSGQKCRFSSCSFKPSAVEQIIPWCQICFWHILQKDDLGSSFALIIVLQLGRFYKVSGGSWILITSSTHEHETLHSINLLAHNILQILCFWYIWLITSSQAPSYASESETMTRRLTHWQGWSVELLASAKKTKDKNINHIRD